MKWTYLRFPAALVLGSLLSLVGNTANAGWGLLGGSSGGYASAGSSGYSASYGSSGQTAAYGSSGYSAAYGSSGYSAAYGSSGYSADYGSSGYSTSYGSSGYSAAYGSSGYAAAPTTGPIRRLLSGVHNHVHAKMERHAARRAAYASSGGSSGYSTASYGSSGYTASYGSSGSSSSYGSSGYSTSYGSSGSYSGGSSGYSSSYGASYSGGSSGGSVSYGSTGSVYYGASNASAGTSAMLASNVRTANDEVYLTVSVPSAAKVYVNGKATSSEGAVRQFVSRGLKNGKSYKFEIRAELQGANGQVATEEKVVTVSAGDRQTLEFAFNEADVKIETAVTLNVPEGATVVLGGNPTKADGARRTFRTSQLTPGEVWDNYEIEVRYQGETKQQSIRLLGGDKLELTFNFDDSADRLASR